MNIAKTTTLTALTGRNCVLYN